MEDGLKGLMMSKWVKAAGLAAVLAAIPVGTAMASSYILGILPKSLNGPGDTSGNNLSCGEGKSLLRQRGYYITQVIDCRPRFYVYFAQRQGNYYTVTVDSQWRRVIGETKE